MENLVPFYSLLKALHILAVIAWMAGLLYLPRLFVYHVENQHKKEIASLFTVMERRLLRGVMLPSLVMTFLFGGLLLCIPGVVSWEMGWIYGKLALVLGLTGFHGWMVRIWRELKNGTCKKTSGFLRCMNEIPFVVAIGIVLLVVLKPF